MKTVKRNLPYVAASEEIVFTSIKKPASGFQVSPYSPEWSMRHHSRSIPENS